MDKLTHRNVDKFISNRKKRESELVRKRERLSLHPAGLYEC